MKKIWVSGLLIGGILSLSLIIKGCKTPQAIADKSGAQLWAENCNRCHNAPDPRTYNDQQWDAIMEHMRQVALLTNTEVEKIRAFLQSANGSN